MVLDFAVYIAAAFFEILGCFAFWAVFKLHKSSLWLFVGVASLIAFAYLLAKIDVAFAGKAYAVYGGIYIAASLVWLWAVEGNMPTKWDVIGSLVSIAGALIILLNARE